MDEKLREREREREREKIQKRSMLIMQAKNERQSNDFPHLLEALLDHHCSGTIP